MRKDTFCVLLAGGKGTRLWPLSREGFSKSFVRIGKKGPLVAEAINRLRGFINNKNIVIVVDKTQEKLLRGFVKGLKGLPKANILVEPFQRSTASAIGLAAIELDPQDIMVVLPTDALIKEPGKFRKTIKKGVDFVRKKENALLCVGIKPKQASTAYGYIKIKSSPGREIYSVDRFIEKPDESKAARLIKKTNYFWNAGMFIFKVKDILEAMRKYAPLLYKELQRIKKDRRKKKSSYLRMKNVSIDYQIMEKAKNLYCIKGNFSWHDLGSWKSIRALFKKDNRGNIRFGKATLVDTHDSIVYNSEKNKIGIVGLKDIVVAHTKDGTLVCSKKDAERVKELVAGLKR